MSVSLTLPIVHQTGVLSAPSPHNGGTFFICPPGLCKCDGCPFDQTVPALEVVGLRVIKVSAKAWKGFLLLFTDHHIQSNISAQFASAAETHLLASPAESVGP